MLDNLKFGKRDEIQVVPQDVNRACIQFKRSFIRVLKVKAIKLNAMSNCVMSAGGSHLNLGNHCECN